MMQNMCVKDKQFGSAFTGGGGMDLNRAEGVS